MNVDAQLLASLNCLTINQKNKLSAGGVTTVKDLILANPPDLARQVKLGLDEVNLIVNKMSEELEEDPVPLSEAGELGSRFTTGDKLIDDALGGGIRTGLLWEFCGESGSGKTQLAMQLALTVQLPHTAHGLDGNACYITTVGSLRTGRMVEMIAENPLFQNSSVSLANIHTIPIRSVPGLISVLRYQVPSLIERLRSTNAEQSTSRSNLKLLVVDSITHLVRTTGKTSTKTLVERSKFLYQIAAALRAIAFKHHVAIVIVNEVADTFNQPLSSHDRSTLELFQYQFQFIGRAGSYPGEDQKEAALGMVWSNQINVRTMMTRTTRRYITSNTEEEPSTKRRRIESTSGMPTYESIHDDLENSTLLRRMSVIFNPTAHPVSLDYIITSIGVLGISLVGESFSSQALPVASSSQSRQPPIQTNEEVDQRLWGELDGFDDSLWSERERDGPLDPLDLQLAITGASSTGASQLPPSEGQNGPRSDEAEEELWENMPDLTQFITPDNMVLQNLPQG